MLRSKKIILGFMAAMLTLVPTILSASSEAALIYLLIEPDSRAGAMGQAFTAQADDGFATYWNPGAMAFNRETKVGWMHTNWMSDIKGLEDMYYEYISGYTYLEDIGNVGLSLTYMTYGEQDAMDSEGNFKSTFESADWCFAASYAFQMSRNLGLGVNAKFVYSQLVPDDVNDDVTASNTNGEAISFAFDFATKWRNVGVADFQVDGLDLGLNLQNLGPAITYNDREQEDPMPLNLRGGISYRILEDQYTRLVLNADFTKELSKRGENPLARVLTGIFEDFDETVYAAGAEFSYLDLLDLRAGYHYDDAGEIKGASFGAGLHYTFSKRYFASLDFAFQPAGELTDYNKTFSVSFYF